MWAGVSAGGRWPQRLVAALSMLDCGSSACFALGAAGIGEPTLCRMQAFFGQSCELASVLLTCAMALNVRALMVKRVPLRDLEVISLLNAPRILGRDSCQSSSPSSSSS